MNNPKRYDSAYPGSMFEKPDGSFIELNDVDSLASALVANYYDMRRSVDDWTDTAIQNEKRAQVAEQQRDELLAALKYIAQFIDPTSADAEQIIKYARSTIAKQDVK